MPGLTWKRMFATERGPYADVLWEKRDALITKADGSIVFQQKGVESPTTWSQLCVNVVAQKYLRGYVDNEGNPGANRETSIKGMIDRVVDTIAGWAGYDTGVLYDNTLAEDIVRATYDRPALDWDIQRGRNGNAITFKRPKETMQNPGEVYFADKASWEAWRDDMKWLIVNQRFSFNSPVWFNVGIAEHPQCSACFIVRLEDYFTNEAGGDFELDDHGLLAAQVKEGIIFSRGSGSGINLSRVRSKRERLSGGGQPTGPVSFAKGLDTWASQIKSGGKTRRAAKMLILDVDHPDVLDFIHMKATEEKIAKSLIKMGYPRDMDGEAYQHAFHQNSNLSVRVPDSFMRAVADRKSWDLVSRSHHFLQDKPEKMTMIGTSGRVLETLNAFEMMQEIGQSCWECGDPGMQFSDTINDWHTCADTEPIVASNPCSEYLFLDETACNLGSFNLRSFLHEDLWEDGKRLEFDAEAFVAATRIFTVAMEVIVSNSKYPTKNFARMSDKYRTLGTGYANLGGMLMELGVPYDSDEGREIAAVITSLLCAEAYSTSAAMAHLIGAFSEYEHNKNSCLHVMRKHLECTEKLTQGLLSGRRDWKICCEQALTSWNVAVGACVSGKGLRNAQATVLAPTGTIAFMMDCETTGIEPELGLVKFKSLAGGGTLKIVNPLAEKILTDKIPPEMVTQVMNHLLEGKSIRTFGQSSGMVFNPEQCEIFRTSLAPEDDPDFTLPWDAHIKMMAAVQPFISGAISKTVNMPNSATPEDMINAYTMAWHLGLKAVAIYRDGSKDVQAIGTSQGADGSVGQQIADTIKDHVIDAIKTGNRKGLPSRVPTDRFKFVIDDHKGYLHVGYYPDTGKVAEIFVKMAKTGSTLNGLIDGFCRAFSIGLQYGAPLEDLALGYLETRFDPAGIVQEDAHVKSCRSILDYISQKLLAVESERQNRVTPEETPGVYQLPPEVPAEKPKNTRVVRTGRVCRTCNGTNVVMNGNCMVCQSCGSTEGGCYQ